ncbi:hypothetical protein PMZ80_004655 [Knufia obscura]|uniref:RRM domain-containing protein n=1 Tax=Knufia obscura TaxID=1635080 RepID=A0ABR0RSR3_9EURO|nr:hypothetical protein PMZ80_004655 [Knufia obscura]
MERQDLTQAQLGSFKFTPVDEAVHQTPQYNPHPLLLQQYSESLQNAGFDRQLSSPDIAADPSFFNHQIRPSLDSSRLRLGPAAVRAAVESASTSPQKRFSRDSQCSMRPNAPFFHPRPLNFSENDSLPSMFTSEGYSATMSDEGIQAFSNSNASLLRALETEQEAHHSSKSQLEQETHARLEAEAETRRLAEHNKSLLNSIKLLQSTVKHMTQKENMSPIVNNLAANGTVEPQEPQPEGVSPNDSILYDVLSNYKVPHKTTKNGKETTSMINLDLLSTPDTNDKSEQAEMQRTLRRQMGLSSEDEPEMQKQINAGEAKDHTLLVPEIEPVSPRTTQAQVHDTASINGQSTANGASATASARPQTPEQKVPPPEFAYSLPAAFLSKYGKKPVAASEGPKLTAEEEESPPPQTPRKATLTVASAVKVRDLAKDDKPPSRTVYMPDSPMINWKVDGRHVNELRGRYVETKHQSHFTDHPIRYVPTMADENIFRTVMIDFIPFGTPYCDALAQIRGGSLESIQMYGPIGDATDFVTARVIYTDEIGANTLYRRGQDPGIKINGKPVRVWQVLEPTYPKNKELEEAIYMNGHTRILIINAPIDDVDGLLKRKLRRQIEAGLVLNIGRSYDGVPIVEFTSIEEATKALQMFLEDRDFSGSDFDFDDDYCAAKYPPLET